MTRLLPLAALPALEAIDRIAPAQRQALVAAIRADRALAADVLTFPTLGWDRQRALIERIMALESKAFGAERPQFVALGGAGK